MKKVTLYDGSFTRQNKNYGEPYGIFSKYFEFDRNILSKHKIRIFTDLKLRVNINIDKSKYLYIAWIIEPIVVRNDIHVQAR